MTKAAPSDAQQQADRTVEFLPLKSLKPNPQNPKRHHGDTIDASISRFGIVDLITLDQRTGYIVSGHGRVDALKAKEQVGDPAPEGVRVSPEGEWLVPVVTGWASASDTEASAALIAMNRTTELGGWVDEALLDLLSDLSEMDEGFAGVGFDEFDLKALAHLTSDDGPRDLDDLADEYGDPTEEDKLVRVVLKVPAQIADDLKVLLGSDPITHLAYAEKMLRDE